MKNEAKKSVILTAEDACLLSQQMYSLQYYIRPNYHCTSSVSIHIVKDKKKGGKGFECFDRLRYQDEGSVSGNANCLSVYTYGSAAVTTLESFFDNSN